MSQHPVENIALSSAPPRHRPHQRLARGSPRAPHRRLISFSRDSGGAAPERLPEH